MPEDARLEIRLSTDLLTRIDHARGDVPRAAWIRRALDTATAVSDPELEDLIAVRFALERGAEHPDEEDHRRAGVALHALPTGGGRRLKQAKP